MQSELPPRSNYRYARASCLGIGIALCIYIILGYLFGDPPDELFMIIFGLSCQAAFVLWAVYVACRRSKFLGYFLVFLATITVMTVMGWAVLLAAVLSVSDSSLPVAIYIAIPIMAGSIVNGWVAFTMAKSSKAG